MSFVVNHQDVVSASQAAADGASVLRARGAHEMPIVGTTTTRIDAECPDAKPGCYAIVTAGHGAATSIDGKALAGSGTYWTQFAQYNPFGVWQFTEKLTASDWFNGYGAGQYWDNDTPSLAWFYTEINGPQYSGFWDGGAWAWTNWANDTEYYSAFGYNQTFYTYLRIWLQPNGHYYWYAGH